MKKLRVLDLFSGIGGFSLGLERTGGFVTTAFCEIDPFCRKVLNKHWPKVPIYEDVSKAKFRKGQADAIVAGFPCQDLSIANSVWGERAGLAGERSGLYREALRAIRLVRPDYAILENVSDLVGLGLGVILGDLAALGYDAQWHCIPASAIGSPQERDRVWIIANARGVRMPRLVTSEDISGFRPWWARSQADLQLICDNPFQRTDRWPQPLVRGVDDGIPDRAHRVHALGNAVVPQIPEIIGRAILASLKAEKEAA